MRSDGGEDVAEAGPWLADVRGAAEAAGRMPRESVPSISARLAHTAS